MKEISETLRKLAQAASASIRKELEHEFEVVLEESKDALKQKGDDPLFAFAIRTLWSPYAGSRYEERQSWVKSLPERYAKWREENAWLLANGHATGQISKEGIDALARLLVSLRQQQRQLQTLAQSSRSNP